MKFHPDRNRSKADASRKFEDIAEVSGVLSEKDKKKGKFLLLLTELIFLALSSDDHSP